jgi:hypothetical protein
MERRPAVPCGSRGRPPILSRGSAPDPAFLGDPQWRERAELPSPVHRDGCPRTPAAPRPSGFAVASGEPWPGRRTSGWDEPSRPRRSRQPEECGEQDPTCQPRAGNRVRPRSRPGTSDHRGTASDQGVPDNSSHRSATSKLKLGSRITASHVRGDYRVVPDATPKQNPGAGQRILEPRRSRRRPRHHRRRHAPGSRATGIRPRFQRPDSSRTQAATWLLAACGSHNDRTCRQRGTAPPQVHRSIAKIRDREPVGHSHIVSGDADSGQRVHRDEERRDARPMLHSPLRLPPDAPPNSERPRDFLRRSETVQDPPSEGFSAGWRLETEVKERRAWDSNPRRGCPLSSFQDCRHRPLGEPSRTAVPARYDGEWYRLARRDRVLRVPRETRPAPVCQIERELRLPRQPGRRSPTGAQARVEVQPLRWSRSNPSSSRSIANSNSN